MSDSSETNRLLRQARIGDRAAFDGLFERHRAFLHQAVEVRMDRRIQSRLDASDIVQETHIEAARRLDGYLDRRPMPFRLWLRQIAHDRLIMAHRHHLDAARRTVDRDVPLPAQSTMQLARQLLGDGPSPSEALAREDLVRRVRRALAHLPDADREMLLMRNFEGLTNQEVAAVLGIEGPTASKRYGRALLKLHKLLLDTGLTESQL